MTCSRKHNGGRSCCEFTAGRCVLFRVQVAIDSLKPQLIGLRCCEFTGERSLFGVQVVLISVVENVGFSWPENIAIFWKISTLDWRFWRLISTSILDWDFMKSWKTSAVSTTVWMVETQLCNFASCVVHQTRSHNMVWRFFYSIFNLKFWIPPK